MSRTFYLLAIASTILITLLSVLLTTYLYFAVIETVTINQVKTGFLTILSVIVVDFIIKFTYYYKKRLYFLLISGLLLSISNIYGLFQMYNGQMSNWVYNEDPFSVTLIQYSILLLYVISLLLLKSKHYKWLKLMGLALLSFTLLHIFAYATEYWNLFIVCEYMLSLFPLLWIFQFQFELKNLIKEDNELIDN